MSSLCLAADCFDKVKTLWTLGASELSASDGSPLLWNEWPSQHIVEVRPSSVIELEDDMADSTCGEEQLKPSRGSGMQDHHPAYLLLPPAGCLMICDVDPAISKFDIYDELSVGKKEPGSLDSSRALATSVKSGRWGTWPTGLRRRTVSFTQGFNKTSDLQPEAWCSSPESEPRTGRT